MERDRRVRLEMLMARLAEGETSAAFVLAMDFERAHRGGGACAPGQQYKTES